MLTKVINNSALGFTKEVVLELVMSNKESEHFLYRVGGIIEGHEIGRSHFKRVNKETGEAENQTWTRFFGEFVAATKDGKTYEAATCFLPSYVNGQFVTGLLEEGNAEIEFGYDIFAVYSKQSATSYEFLAVPIKKADEPDRLENIKRILIGNLPKPAALIDQKSSKK